MVGTKRATPIDLELESRLTRARDLNRPGSFGRMMDQIEGLYRTSAMSTWTEEGVRKFFSEQKGRPTDRLDFQHALRRKGELSLKFEVNEQDYQLG